MRKRSVLAMLLCICLLFMVGCSTSNQQSSGEESNADDTETAGDEASADEIDWSRLPEEWKASEDAGVNRSGKEAQAKVSDDGKIKVGWCPPEMLPYYELVLQGVNEAIAEIGEDKIELVVQAPANQASGATEQLNIIENWVSQDFDAIIVSATDDGMLNSVFEQASGKGIAIFEFNMPLELVENEYYVSNCSPSGYKAGLEIGNWVIDNYGDEEEVKVAVLEGIAGLHTDLRKQGFEELLAEHDNFEIVASQPADWNRDKAATVTENILSANPDIDIIYALYDDMALGAASVLESKGMSGDVAVLGYDMTEEGLEAIKNGTLSGSVYNGAKRMGYDSIIAAYRYCAEGIMVPKVIVSTPVMVDADNADDFKDFD